MMLDIVILKRGQYLSMVDPFKSSGIPTDTIIYKEVPGAGITTFAYKYFRQDVICCLPNKPVIEDKVARHNATCKPSERILGVHKGITNEDVIEYLSDELITHKKILTTPEGFMSKVVPAFGNNQELMFSQFFFLIDECERVITDVSYRGNIAAPLDMFFHFHRKAMVSATVLEFTDPRLEMFKRLYIEPDYDYCKRLKLIETNNVVEALRERLEELNSNHVLIFLNSTDTILAVARELNIVNESHAYCSEDSAYKLFLNHFKNPEHRLDVATLGKYNFFTSRFFSAFDIVLDYKPDVIMVTDVYAAPHSVLDPFTEVIQIAGRCRNGVNSLAHIANFNPALSSMSKEEAYYYLQGCFDTYQSFVDLESKSDHPGVKDTLREAIENSMAHSFYTDGKLNTFMVDNFIHEERVKGYYQNADNLKAAYAQKSKHFLIDFDIKLYPLSDADRRRRESHMSLKERRKEIALQLDKITPSKDRFPIVSHELTNYMRKLDPRITNAFDKIGLAGLEQTDYSYPEIDKAVAKHKRLEGIRSIAPNVFATFNPNTFYFEREVTAKLGEFRQQHKLPGRTTATMIKHFFEAVRTTNRRATGWMLGNVRDPNNADYSIE